MKAPEFDDIPDFDKNSNGLWEIHVKVSSQGLVFVNLDTVKVPSDFEERELDIDLKYSKISHSKRVNSWRYDCDFNWKIARKFRPY
jgi:phenylpropionate dioxygenase-like ring-hydroxylating dioxygenase large terminal subunit